LEQIGHKRTYLVIRQMFQSFLLQSCQKVFVTSSYMRLCIFVKKYPHF
jgi:hypothetical protein